MKKNAKIFQALGEGKNQGYPFKPTDPFLAYF